MAYKNELDKFIKHRDSELGEVTRNLEKAKSDYETAIKNFVIKHITSKDHFKERFIESLGDTLSLIENEPIWIVMGDSAVNVLTYENMITDKIFSLKEEQIDESEIYCEEV